MTAEVKLFEVRDTGTTMPVIAIKPDPVSRVETWLYGRSGYGLQPSDMLEYVLLAPLAGGSGLLVCDPYAHPGAPTRRTLWAAHTYIINEWAKLASGQVIDVQYILGETKAPKKSESLDRP